MGDYDSAAVAYSVIGQLETTGLINRDDLKILDETETIPNPCYVIRPGLPQDLKDALLEFFLAWDDDAYFEALYSDPKARFIRAYDSDYAVVEEMVRVLKLEE
jgi:phosphonate transport system substrate-binding protein